MKLLENTDELQAHELEPKDAVIIQFGPFNGLDEIRELDERLFQGIPDHIGQHDGHEVAVDDSHGTLFTYGQNAEILFKTMQPILSDFDFLNGASVYLEFKVGKKEPLEIEFDFVTTPNQQATNEQPE